LEQTDIDAVADLLLAGNVVAFPTDTVFGLAVIYDNEAALQMLKDAKGRGDDKPIPTMVGNLDQLRQIAETNAKAELLAKRFMPGALTLIMKKRARVARYVTNGRDTIGIRMPNDPFVSALLQKCKKPLLVTSANQSGAATGKTAEQVLEQLDGRIHAIVMGSAKGDIASTIVDVTGADIKILRTGLIDERTIRSALSQENKEESR